MAPAGIKSIFMFARLLGGFALAAVAFSAVLTLLYCLTLFYFCYRLIWLFSTEGAILRMEYKFKRHIQLISQEGSRQRAMLSSTIDQENIGYLVMLINEAMNLRKAHLDPVIVQEIQSLLIRCRNTEDFNQGLQIYKIVVDTDVALLNSSLAELLND
jgi:hypothetical protein